MRCRLSPTADVPSHTSGAAMGRQPNSCAAANSGPFRNCLSGVQLIEQRLGLLQIERVEAFGEPAVDRREQIAGLAAACPDRATAAPCSSPRAAPRTLPAAHAQPRAHARNTLPLSPHPAPATCSAISPAMRWISASHHLSLVVSTAVIASPMQRQASSNWPSSA